MPANKYASGYLNAAYARCTGQISDLETPAFGLFPTPDQFENGKDFMVAFARAVDDFVHSFAVEASSNATIPINTSERISLLGNALSDCGLLSDLDEAAERIREDQLEAAE